MRVALLVGVTLLAGCQLKFHQDYQGDDAATLLFSSDDLAAQPVICVPGEGFRDTRVAVGRGGMKLLDDLNEAMGKSPEVKVQVAASDTLVAGFRYQRGGRHEERQRCRAAHAFQVEAGKTYQLMLGKGNDCPLTVSVTGDDGWQPHPSQVTDWSCP